MVHTKNVKGKIVLPCGFKGNLIRYGIVHSKTHKLVSVL